MNTFQKICNVFGILLGLLLSIVFVLLLITATPALGALSVANPSALADIRTDIDISKFIPPSEEYPDLGEKVQVFLASNAAKEVVELYMTDVYNALSGNGSEQLFTKDRLLRLLEEHMDDLVTTVQKSKLAPNYTPEKIREEIQSAVDTHADEILAQIPHPQEIVETTIGDQPQLQKLFKLITQKETIEACVIAVIAFFTLLIFLCRLPGFRGFRWVATDLYIGAAFMLLQGLAVKLGADAILRLLPADIPVEALVMPVIGAFSSRILCAAALALGVAVTLTVAYRLMRKHRSRNAAEKTVPVAQLQ